MESYKSKLLYGIKVWATNYPVFYLGILSAINLIGYAYILLFPALVLCGSLFLVTQYPFSGILENSAAIIAWTGLLMLAIVICHKMLIVKPVQPKGLRVNAKTAAGLHRHLQANQAELFEKFDEILLTDDDNIDVIYTPSCGFPFRIKKFFLIGLPTVMFYSPDQAHALIARKHHQYAKRECFWVNWLRQSEHLWRQYLRCYQNKKGLDWEILYYFFYAFCPFYQWMAKGLDALEALRADQCALTEINDQILLETVQSHYIFNSFLYKSFWLRIGKVKKFVELESIHPMQELNGEIDKIRRNPVNFHWLQDNVDAVESFNAFIPFCERIANLGHRQMVTPTHQDGSAAVHWLGADLNKVVGFIDKLWHNRQLMAHKPSPVLPLWWEKLLNANKSNSLRHRYH